VAATFAWKEKNGAGLSLPGQTITTIGWKNTDNYDETTPGQRYIDNPVTAGNNSYTKIIYGHFSGSFNEISAGLFAHTAGTLTNIVLKGPVTMSASGDAFANTTPSTTALSPSSTMTGVTAIGGGVTVWFSGTTPDSTTTKASSSTANPTYTNFLTTQMQVGASAIAGDHPITLTLQYNES